LLPPADRDAKSKKLHLCRSRRVLFSGRAKFIECCSLSDIVEDDFNGHVTSNRFWVAVDKVADEPRALCQLDKGDNVRKLIFETWVIDSMVDDERVDGSAAR
jgi:hypothetical protein